MFRAFLQGDLTGKKVFMPLPESDIAMQKINATLEELQSNMLRHGGWQWLKGIGPLNLPPKAMQTSSLSQLQSSSHSNYHVLQGK